MQKKSIIRFKWINRARKALVVVTSRGQRHLRELPVHEKCSSKHTDGEVDQRNATAAPSYWEEGLCVAWRHVSSGVTNDTLRRGNQPAVE